MSLSDYLAARDARKAKELEKVKSWGQGDNSDWKRKLELGEDKYNRLKEKDQKKFNKILKVYKKGGRKLI